MECMMKTKQDNELTDHTGMVYDKNYIELLGPIESVTIYDKKQTGQWCDQSYKCGICQKGNLTVVTDQTGCSLWWKLDKTMMWPIVQEWSTLKMKLNYQDQSERVSTMTKSN